MFGFFLCIIIMFVLMFRGLCVIGGRGVRRLAMFGENIQKADETGADVVFYSFYSQTFKEQVTKAFDSHDTNRNVYKAKDIRGIDRWYYVDTKEPCIHYDNPVLKKKFEEGLSKARWDNKNWFVVPNFWDMGTYKANSVYLDNYLDCKDEEKPKTYIHGTDHFNDWHDPEYKTVMIKNEYGEVINYSHHIYHVRTPEERKQYFYDNGKANVKVYVKNMRPYQLHQYKRFEGKGSWTKHYFIRFMLEEKQHDMRYHVHAYGEKYNSDFWTAWYAITEEQYFSLSNQRRDADELICEELLQKDLNRNCKIALKRTNKETTNRIEDDELIWAFDDDGNFVGESLENNYMEVNYEQRKTEKN